MDNKAWLIGVALALSGCESKEGRLEREAKAALFEVMIDPTSFLTRKLSRGSDHEAICGEVNGKNRMGGYVGFRPFVATGLREGETPQVAIRSDSSETGTSASSPEQIAYKALYEQFCEPPPDKATRLEAERQAEIIRKKIEDELAAEETAQKKKTEAAERARKNARALFARLNGEWRQDISLCFSSDQSGIVRIDTETLGYDNRIFSIHSIDSSGDQSIKLVGRMITRDGIGDTEERTISVISSKPLTIKIYEISYYSCRR